MGKDDGDAAREQSVWHRNMKKARHLPLPIRRRRTTNRNDGEEGWLYVVGVACNSNICGKGISIYA